MNTDDVQYLDWQWVEEHPESALDLMLKLHSENAALRSLLREAITDHVSPYDLPESEDYIARVRAALGQDKP